MQNQNQLQQVCTSGCFGEVVLVLVALQQMFAKLLPGALRATASVSVQCPICMKQFSTWFKVVEHGLGHRSASEPFACIACQAAFASQAALDVSARFPTLNCFCCMMWFWFYCAGPHRAAWAGPCVSLCPVRHGPVHKIAHCRAPPLAQAGRCSG